MNKHLGVPVKEKISYGVGDFAINIAYGSIGFYFVFFLTDVAGVPAEWAGSIFLIARIWDAVTDYAMGVISDRTRSRWGRRRPYILFGGIPFAATFALLWIVPFESDALLFAYYVSITILFNTAFTIVAIPYNAMLPEISQDYDERTSISGYKMGLSFVGTLLAAAGTAFIIDVMFAGREFYQEGFSVMGVAFAIVILLSLSVTFVGTRERVSTTRTAQETGFLTNLKSILKLPEFRVVLAMFLLNMVGFDLVQVVLIFFLKHVIKVSDDLVFIFMAIPLVVAVLSAPLWVVLGQKWGKKNAFIVAAVYLFVSFLLCLIIPEGNVVFMGVLCAFAGIGVSASQVIPFSIIPDIIEIDEYENGTRREGAFYGVTMFLYKAASAIAINVATLFLAAFGYMEATAGQAVEESVQPESAVWAIRILMGVGPGICFLLAAAFVRKLSITKERFDEVRLALEERSRDEFAGP